METQFAVTPAGSPTAVPIPVAPVVECVILVNTVFKHKLCEEEAALTVLIGVTTMVPVAFTVPQPPVSGML